MGIGVKQDMESAKRWYMRAAGKCFARLMAMINESSTTTQTCHAAFDRIEQRKEPSREKGRQANAPRSVQRVRLDVSTCSRLAKGYVSSRVG